MRTPLLGKEDPSNAEYQATQGMIDLEYESDGKINQTCNAVCV